MIPSALVRPQGPSTPVVGGSPRRIWANISAGLAGAALACGVPTQSVAQQPTLTVEPLESGTTSVLQAVSPIADDTVWVSGHEGSILRSRDGGDTWTRVPSPAGDSLQFRDVHAFTWQSAIVLSAGEGATSRIYHTGDGGATWSRQFVMNDPRGFLDCLDFWDSDRGFAYGDSFGGRLFILVTADGGTTWTRPDSSDVPGATEGEGGFAASGTCARAGTDGRGWIGTGAGGAARLLETEDYGAHWRSLQIPMARGDAAGVFTIAMGESAPAMILGGDLGSPEQVTANAAVSLDGGASWTQATAGAPVPGAVYGSATAQAGNYRWIFALAPTASAFTADLGSTWHPLDEVRAWAGAFAASGRVGWAVGGGGRVWRLRIGGAP